VKLAFFQEKITIASRAGRAFNLTFSAQILGLPYLFPPAGNR
jgi:hypothetical protein